MVKRYKKSSVSADSVQAASADRRLLLFLEYAILIFTGFCIIWYSLYVIVPFINLVSKTPLRQMIRYLRYIGVFLTVANLILARRLRQAPGVFCLYGICLIAAVSSLVQLEYGYRNNLVTIEWMLTLSCLFYGALFRMKRRRLLVFVTVTYMILLVIWSVASWLSLAQFVLQIGEDGPNYATTPWLGGVGFARHRLFGVFGYPEYGSVTGLMLLIIGAYYFIRLRSRFVRIFIVLFSLPFFPYIVISGSRNAALAFGLVLFTGTLLFLWKNRELALRRSLPLSLQAAAASVIIFLVLYMGTRLIAAHIPPLFSGTGGNDTAEITTGKSIYDQPDNDLPGRDQLINDLATNDLAIKGLVSGSPASGIKTGLSGMHSLVAESHAPAVAFTSDSAFASESAFALDSAFTSDFDHTSNAGRKTKTLSTDKSSGKTAVNIALKEGETAALISAEKEEDKEKEAAGEKAEDTENTQEEGLLDRRYKGGELSNGRRDIWSNYLSMAGEIGLIGFSPENAGFVIQKIHPELYICRIIRRHQPDLYKTGYVYHTHSGYLRVFVATGFLGLALLIIFIIRCAHAVFRQILRSRSLSLEFLFSLLIVVAGAVTAMFDNELFFNMNPESLIFWAALAILIKNALTTPKVH
ncbi:MAG: hypothetical protein E7239_04885 [Sarcina sp.]|nr:hypothetical protein [Sarcina sp.]